MGLVGPAAADTANWLNCAPALPKFCANIHIGCAGRSKLDTWPFELAFKTGALQREGHAPVSLDVTYGDRSAVFRFPGTRDWIRIEDASDKPHAVFNQRIYRKGRALMTRGTCQYD